MHQNPGSEWVSRGICMSHKPRRHLPPCLCNTLACLAIAWLPGRLHRCGCSPQVAGTELWNVKYFTQRKQWNQLLPLSTLHIFSASDHFFTRIYSLDLWHFATLEFNWRVTHQHHRCLADRAHSSPEIRRPLWDVNQRALLRISLQINPDPRSKVPVTRTRTRDQTSERSEPESSPKDLPSI